MDVGIKKIAWILFWGICLLLFFANYSRILTLIRSAQTDAEGTVKYYAKCQTLKVGMSEVEIIGVMGSPFEVYYSSAGPQSGKKILKYRNPRLMDDDNRIYIDTTTALASLIYCANVRIK